MSATRKAGHISGKIFRPLVMHSHFIVLVWREEAVTFIALNSLPLATVMSHCILKCVQSLCNVVCVSVCSLQSCKSRMEVEHPSKALLTLLSFFLCSLSDLISVLLSLPVPPRWCKVEMAVSTGCFPLIDVVLWVSHPHKLHRFLTDYSSVLCNPCFIFIFCLKLSICIVHLALVSSSRYLLCLVCCAYS